MDTSPVTLIYTNSFDTTTDLLISKLGSERIFRLNFDLWRDYRIWIDPDGFRIQNPTGRTVQRSSVSKAYWRKPMRKQHMFPDKPTSMEDNYMEEEIWYAMREVVNLLWCDGKLILVEPFGDSRAGKFVQAAAARKYFQVPPFRFVSGEAVHVGAGSPVAVKSLTSGRVKAGAVLYTTKVENDVLAPETPWAIQDFVKAEKDVTVVFVRDRLFAFELGRMWFIEKTADWREVSLDPASSEWPVHVLPPAIERGIFGLMADLGLQYGRLDFLLAGGEYYFLEVNSNGEWGWLDCDNQHGLLQKMQEEINPSTPVRALPFARSITL